MFDSRLLVFGTVYLRKWVLFSFFLFISIQTQAAGQVQGFCFDIYAGSTLQGYSLEVKKFEDNVHTKLIFMEHIPSESSKKTTKTAIQTLKLNSDQNFTPLKSLHEIYKNDTLVQSLSTSFESTPKDKIKILKLRKGQKKPTLSEESKGLVLSQHMTDLLFHRKKITELDPKEKLVFQTYSETDGTIKQVTSQLEGQSDHLVLIHQMEGDTFKSSHANDGTTFSNHDLTKNIKLKPCTSASVLTHLNSALKFKTFKALFSFDEREKIKSCCHLF